MTTSIQMVQLLQNTTDFVAAEHHRYPDREVGARHRVEPAHLGAEHVLVQKQQGTERRVLRGRTHASLDGEPGQKRRYVSSTHLGRMRLPMKHAVPSNPVGIAARGESPALHRDG